METLGPGGESILDYSVYDAIRAGFGKVVFVLNDAIAADFEERYRPRLAGRIEDHYVVQRLSDLPAGFELSQGRVKPWGTGHAVRAAREAVAEPFLVINADDFYGREAFEAMAKMLAQSTNDYAMYGYRLGNTLSKHGTVSRGVCSVDGDALAAVNENTGIARGENGAIHSDQHPALPDDAIVSMNFWGFQPDAFALIETMFADFLRENGQSEKAEFYIPSVIQRSIDRGGRVRVVSGASPWFGMTYKSERDETREAINALISKGVYPAKLWE